MEHTLFLLNWDFSLWGITTLIASVGLPATHYAYQQLRSTHDDSRVIIGNMLLLLAVLWALAATQNLFVFLASWLLLPFILSRLIAEPLPSPEATASSEMALRTLTLGSLSLAAGAAVLLTLAPSGSFSSIQALPPSPTLDLALVFAIIAAGIQAGLVPAHTWLLSSLWAITPVSALMHAGFINAGGFLLLRLAPLISGSLMAQKLLLLMGFVSVALGSLMALIQPEQKRALACSTIAQMGFLFVEAGLGLYAMLAAHMIGHGMYKAHAFLGMGFALKYRESAYQPLSPFWGLFSGALLVLLAHMGQPQLLGQISTTLFIDALLLLLGFHLAGAHHRASVLLLSTGIIGLGYQLWHSLFHASVLSSPFPWGTHHTVLAMGFALLMLIPQLIARSGPWGSWCYCQLLRASQAAPSMVRAQRHSQYQEEA